MIVVEASSKTPMAEMAKGNMLLNCTRVDWRYLTQNYISPKENKKEWSWLCWRLLWKTDTRQGWAYLTIYGLGWWALEKNRLRLCLLVDLSLLMLTVIRELEYSPSALPAFNLCGQKTDDLDSVHQCWPLNLIKEFEYPFNYVFLYRFFPLLAEAQIIYYTLIAIRI